MCIPILFLGCAISYQTTLTKSTVITNDDRNIGNTLPLSAESSSYGDNPRTAVKMFVEGSAALPEEFLQEHLTHLKAASHAKRNTDEIDKADVDSLVEKLTLLEDEEVLSRASEELQRALEVQVDIQLPNVPLVPLDDLPQVSGADKNFSTNPKLPQKPTAEAVNGVKTRKSYFETLMESSSVASLPTMEQVQSALSTPLAEILLSTAIVILRVAKSEAGLLFPMKQVSGY
jgi:hypothetical protein